ncbi:MAG: hypothetical protein AAB818_01560 [Patescibacteria group bacterium]
MTNEEQEKKESKEVEIEAGHEFDPNSDACGACGGCGGGSEEGR